MRYKVEIEFSFPYEIRGATQDVKDFIKEALEVWGGQRNPDDPFFDSFQNVKVKGVKKL